MIAGDRTYAINHNEKGGLERVTAKQEFSSVIMAVYGCCRNEDDIKCAINFKSYLMAYIGLGTLLAKKPLHDRMSTLGCSDENPI